MSDFAEKMAAARKAGRAGRSIPVCLRGDLVAELEELDRRALIARANPAASKEDTAAAELAERICALQDEMRDGTEPFELRALAPARYQALREQHPPRRDDNGKLNLKDAGLGFNSDTFLPALIRACTVSPQLTEAQWHDLLGDTETAAAEKVAAGEEPDEGLLTYRQYMDLAGAAHELNEGAISVPFSSAVSPTSGSSDGE